MEQPSGRDRLCHGARQLQDEPPSDEKGRVREGGVLLRAGRQFNSINHFGDF